MGLQNPGSKEFAKEETNWYTLVPTIYNADTLGIRPDLIKRPINSWSELLNPEIQGQGLDPEYRLHWYHGRCHGLRGHG